MKVKFTLLLLVLFLRVANAQSPPAKFYLTGFAGTGACDGTLQLSTCAPYTSNVSGPNYLGWSTTINNMCSGTWSIGLTSSSGDPYLIQLTYSASGVIVYNPNPGTIVLSAFATVLSSTTASPSCNGSINLYIQGGTPPYTVTWRDSSNQTIVGVTNDTLTGVCSGNYSFAVADNTPCIGGGTTYGTLRLPALSCTIETQHVSCAGSCDGAAFLNIVGSGQDIATYSIASFINTDTLLNQCAGIITGSVTDSTNATAVCSSAIPQPPIMQYQEDSITSNGVLYFSVTGGIPPYRSIMDGFDTLIFSSGQMLYDSLSAGPHVLSITDSAGCTFMHNPFVQSTVGLSNPMESDSKIFPNPASNYICVKFKNIQQNNACTLKLYNNTGQLIKEQVYTYANPFVVLKLEDVPQGRYILEVETLYGKERMKIIKE